jgi:hypothetical protein
MCAARSAWRLVEVAAQRRLSSDAVDKTQRGFGSYTAYQIISLGLQKRMKVVIGLGLARASYPALRTPLLTDCD